MSDRIEITERVERVAVWPCDHGNVLIEHGGVPANHQCAKCGAMPEFYVPAHLLDTAIKSLRELVDAARAVNGVDNANSQKRQRLNGAIGEARSTLSKLERGTE